MRYIADMKTTTIPSIRVEPELRDQAEQVLREGESLSAFIEASVRENVRRRLDQAAFIQRGLASLDAARQGAGYVPADDVVRGLQKRLADARVDQQHKRAPKKK